MCKRNHLSNINFLDYYLPEYYPVTIKAVFFKNGGNCNITCSIGSTFLANVYSYSFDKTSSIDNISKLDAFVFTN